MCVLFLRLVYNNYDASVKTLTLHWNLDMALIEHFLQRHIINQALA